MKCVNCGGVLSSSGCTLCGAGWITPAAIKEYWATMAYKELEAEMSRITEQRDRLLEGLRDLMSLCRAAMRDANKYGGGEYRVNEELKDTRRLLAECEAEGKP